MIRRLVVRREAELEAAEAARWYGEQERGLRVKFLMAVQSTIEAIIDRPLAFPSVSASVRRAMARPFPYGVFYSVEEDVIVILAILDCRRNPEHWQRRN